VHRRTCASCIKGVSCVELVPYVGSVPEIHIFRLGYKTGSPESNDTSTRQEKPPHTQVLVEVSQLEQAFKNYPCSECGEDLVLNLRTVCIATSIRLVVTTLTVTS
jgi:hypothetical protein